MDFGERSARETARKPCKWISNPFDSLSLTAFADSAQTLARWALSALFSRDHDPGDHDDSMQRALSISANVADPCLSLLRQQSF